MAMTDAERFMFDLTGFFVRPGILDADEIAAVKEQVHKITHEPESLPIEERQVPGGASSILLDHPKVMDVLQEIIDPEPKLGAPSIRLDSAFCTWREPGATANVPLHQGGPLQTDALFGYHVQNGRIFAGMVRVIFDLTEVRAGYGGTVFIPGSHKANFPMHPDHLSLEEGKASPLLTSHECPPGSALFFTENVCHSAAPVWRGPHERVTVHYGYSHLGVWYTKPKIAPEVVAALPREQQALFRAPWLVDFQGPRRAPNTVERFLQSNDPPVDMNQFPPTDAALGVDAPSAAAVRLVD